MVSDMCSVLGQKVLQGCPPLCGDIVCAVRHVCGCLFYAVGMAGPSSCRPGRVFFSLRLQIRFVCVYVFRACGIGGGS